MLGKLIERVIGERLQYIKANFVQPNQLDDLKHHLTTDASVLLTQLIYLE